MTILEFLQVTFLSIFMLCLLGYGSIRFFEIILKKKLVHFVNQFFGLSSDFVVKINFFLYMGISFLLMYTQILLMFKIFIVPTLYGLSILLGIILLFDIFKNKDKPLLNRFALYNSLPIMAMIISLSLITLLRSTIISGAFGSTGYDAAVHSVIISRIIRFNMFSPEFRYLPGGEVIAAFLTVILNIPIYKTVTLLTGSFSVLVFLSFYCLGVSHTQKPIYGYLCAFLATLFWFSSYHPIYWGGLPFMTGIYVTVSAMAFSINLATPPVNEQSFHRILFTALLLIPVLTIYPAPLLYILFWLPLLVTKNLISHPKRHRCFKTGVFLIFSLAIAASLSASLLWPIIYTDALPILLGKLSPPSRAMSRGWWDDYLISPIFFLRITEFYNDLNKAHDVLGVASFRLIPYGVLACIVIALLKLAQKYKFKDSIRSINPFLVPFSQIGETGLFYYAFYVVIYLYMKHVWIFRSIFPPERTYQCLGIIFTMLEFSSIVVIWTFLSNVFHLKIRIILHI